MIQFMIVSLLTLLWIPSSALAQTCAANPVAVQILGSGGARINPDRASSSYLLWIGAQARILVDMGGGAFLRFGQAQAKLSDLSLVANAAAKAGKFGATIQSILAENPADIP